LALELGLEIAAKPIAFFRAREIAIGNTGFDVPGKVVIDRDELRDGDTLEIPSLEKIITNCCYGGVGLGWGALPGQSRWRPARGKDGGPSATPVRFCMRPFVR
jgi:hypothetical protein